MLTSLSNESNKNKYILIIYSISWLVKISQHFCIFESPRLVRYNSVVVLIFFLDLLDHFLLFKLSVSALLDLFAVEYSCSGFPLWYPGSLSLGLVTRTLIVPLPPKTTQAIKVMISRDIFLFNQRGIIIVCWFTECYHYIWIDFFDSKGTILKSILRVKRLEKFV